MEAVYGAITTIIIGVLGLVIKKLIDKTEKLIAAEKASAVAKSNAMEEGILALLRVQLIEYHEKYMAKGSIPSYAFDNWTKMYKAYRGLKGNGMLLQMDEDIKELEFKK